MKMYIHLLRIHDDRCRLALEEFFFSGDIVSDLKLMTHSFLGHPFMLGIGDMTFIKKSLGCI